MSSRAKTYADVHVDVPTVDEKNAIVLVVHHLMLAASYFEATPDKIDGLLAEIVNQTGAHDHDRREIAETFVRSLDAYYKATG